MRTTFSDMNGYVKYFYETPRYCRYAKEERGFPAHYSQFIIV